MLHEATGARPIANINADEMVLQVLGELAGLMLALAVGPSTSPRCQAYTAQLCSLMRVWKIDVGLATRREVLAEKQGCKAAGTGLAMLTHAAA